MIVNRYIRNSITYREEVYKISVGTQSGNTTASYSQTFDRTYASKPYVLATIEGSNYSSFTVTYLDTSSVTVTIHTNGKSENTTIHLLVIGQEA